MNDSANFSKNEDISNMKRKILYERVERCMQEFFPEECGLSYWWTVWYDDWSENSSKGEHQTDFNEVPLMRKKDNK